MQIPGNYNVGLLIFGIAMIVIGLYVVAKKDAFGKGENGRMIVEVLKLSEKAKKIISVVQGLLIILIGLFFLINSLLYINGTYWVFKQA